MSNSDERIESLMQLGFPRGRCEQAIDRHGNNMEAATEWLVSVSQESTNPPAIPAGWQGVSASSGTRSVPRRSNQENPLDALSDADVMKVHDCGDGWVVVNQQAQPLLFACEESTWYGKMFAGRMRQAEYLLLDATRRPIVRIEKPFSWTQQSATVSQLSGVQGAEEDNLLGSIQQEFDPFMRRLLVCDATPNHAAGTVVIEAALTDPIFRIKLDGAELGTIVQPRHGMGVANLELAPGALDPFRSNRMRALLLCATLMVCDMYWSMAPGSATYLKVGLPH